MFIFTSSHSQLVIFIEEPKVETPEDDRALEKKESVEEEKHPETAASKEDDGDAGVSC